MDARGVQIRDELVFQFARDVNCPILMVTSGNDISLRKVLLVSYISIFLINKLQEDIKEITQE